jgi:hypothetical protein
LRFFASQSLPLKFRRKLAQPFRHGAIGAAVRQPQASFSLFEEMASRRHGTILRSGAPAWVKA